MHIAVGKFDNQSQVMMHASNTNISKLGQLLVKTNKYIWDSYYGVFELLKEKSEASQHWMNPPRIAANPGQVNRLAIADNPGLCESNFLITRLDVRTRVSSQPRFV